MQNSLNIHEDSRRLLIDIPLDPKWKTLKYVECLQDCVLGAHYHKNKDELFVIIKGRVLYDDMVFRAGDEIEIPRGTYHEFDCDKGVVLMCLASELYEPDDEHKL